MAITNVMSQKEKRPREKKRKHADAYKNVKIWLSLDEIKLIRTKVKGTQNSQVPMTVCDYIEFQLVEGFDRNYIAQLEDPEYAEDGKYVNAWLNREDHDRLHDIAIEWNMTIRRAAHKILTYQLERIGGQRHV